MIYVGAGTSGRLGLLDAVECYPTFGSRDVQAVLAGGLRAVTRAVEGAEDDVEAGPRALARLSLSSRDVVCGVSASGTTPFVLSALRYASGRGANTALITCAAAPRSGAPGPAVRHVVRLRTGAEVVAGSTRLKAGTATKVVLNLISTGAMIATGRVYRGRMVDLVPANAKLRARAVRMVAELSGLERAQASALLERAGGHPRLALVMHASGLPAGRARRILPHTDLSQLQPAPRRRRVKP